MKYLIAIAVGPVQDFISTARRSRDLWFGSWLLSELSKAAAHVIVQLHKKESLIFPSIADPSELLADSSFNVVNKILAEVETEDVRSLMGVVKGAIDDRLAELRTKAFAVDDRAFRKEVAIAQVEDLVEFFWGAVPLLDYKVSRERVEALLTARKNTRNFTSTRQWAGNVPKSSLDGQRESVIDESAYPTRDDSDVRKALKVRHLFECYRARGGERLCGVGLLKRCGNRKGEDSFFSTSHVAALPLMSAVTDQARVGQYVSRLVELGVKREDLHAVPLAPLTQAYPSAFVIPGGERHAGRARDGHILFEERLRDYFDTKTAAGKKDFQYAKEALRSFLKDVFCGSMREPLPYYALLHADGDWMGPAIEAQGSKVGHQELSAELSAFARRVAKIVEDDHHGSLVYSGGDDVLAFLPLHTVLDCARDLKEDFSDKLKAFKGRTGQLPTLSVGLAITHHIEPLSDALDLAREAEREAKRLRGKNALCIKVSKRSGETTTAVGRWGGIDERLRFFSLLHLADKVPDGVAYELRSLAEHLKHAEKAIPGEVERILRRKRSGHGETELDEKVIIRFNTALAELGNTANRASTLLRLADELIIARMLAAGCEQSFQNQETAKKIARRQLQELLQRITKESEG